MGVGALPNLAVSFLRRFDVDNGRVIPADGFPPHRDSLMDPLTPVHMFWVHDLSPMAKLDEYGNAQQKWNYELPPQEVLRALVQPYHITGVQDVGDITYGTQAMGPVNVAKITGGGTGLVSRNFRIVP